MKMSSAQILRGMALLLMLTSPSANAAFLSGPEEKKPAPPQEPECSADIDPAFALRKSMAVLDIAVEQPSEASDMPKLGAAVSRFLQTALAADESLRVRDGSRYSLTSAQINLLGQYDSSAESQLASLSRELNSQLIISGRITDVSRRNTDNGDMLGRLVQLSGLSTGQRHFALELSVYDGYSGAELLSKRFSVLAEGEVDMSGLAPLSGDFIASDYGQAVSKLLTEAAAQLQRSTSCIPMMTTIVGIDGETLRIAEGNDSLLRPGDRMRIFHRRYIGVDRMGRERFQEEYIGDAQVTHIFPQAALLQLNDSARLADLRPGDIARAW